MQAYHFTQSLLHRWKAGDRYGLWLEAVAASRNRTRRERHQQERQAVLHREVERLVSLGRVGEALED